MKPQTEVNRFIARDDVGFVLEPMVKALLAQGMNATQALETVTESAKRVIRLSLSDAGERPLAIDALNAEAQRAAKTLIDRVTNPVRRKAA
jgi:hypothetical protein